MAGSEAISLTKNVIACPSLVIASVLYPVIASVLYPVIASEAKQSHHNPTFYH
jgi:hypothetical protein